MDTKKNTPNKDYDTTPVLETMPRSLLFTAAGGLKTPGKAMDIALDTEKRLIRYMMQQGLTIEVAAVEGQWRLVFAQKPEGNLPGNL